MARPIVGVEMLIDTERCVHGHTAQTHLQWQGLQTVPVTQGLQ